MVLAERPPPLPSFAFAKFPSPKCFVFSHLRINFRKSHDFSIIKTVIDNFYSSLFGAKMLVFLR